MKTKIYYSVQNGGDGSAYPLFVESERLAKWDQDHMDEGWAEPCTGCLEIESSEPVTVKDVTTEIGYLLNEVVEDDGYEYHDEFVAAFFPDGLPEFVVTAGTNYYYVRVDGRSVARVFAWHNGKAGATEEGRLALQEKVNSLC